MSARWSTSEAKAEAFVSSHTLRHTLAGNSYGGKGESELKLLQRMVNPFALTVKGGEGVQLIQAARHEGGGYWFLTLFAIHGRAMVLVPLLVYAAYTILVVCIVHVFFQDRIEGSVASSMQMATILVGTALFFLQTFRTNSAYARWWEGRILWDQANSTCSSVARHMAVGSISSRSITRKIIRWACAYLVALKTSLRSYEDDIDELLPLLSRAEFEELENVTAKDRPLYAVQKITEYWVEAERKKLIINACDKEFEKLVPDLTRYISSMRRIGTTPMPFAYIVHLRSFLVIWMSFLPWVLLPGLGYATILVCLWVAYALMGMEGICLEIESPFGSDFNDLPTDDFVLETVKVLLDAYATTHKLPIEDGDDDGDGDGFDWPLEETAWREERMQQPATDAPSAGPPRLGLCTRLFRAAQLKAMRVMGKGRNFESAATSAAPCVAARKDDCSCTAVSAMIRESQPQAAGPQAAGPQAAPSKDHIEISVAAAEEVERDEPGCKDLAANPRAGRQEICHVHVPRWSPPPPGSISIDLFPCTCGQPGAEYVCDIFDLMVPPPTSSLSC